jgi:hypothetical protein
MAVTPSDIAARLGRPLTSAEVQQVPIWITDAEGLIERRAARMGVAVDGEARDRIVALAVVAMARNPDDSTQVDVAVDDARVSRRYSSSAGQVAIIDAWWSELGLAERSSAFSTRPGFEPDRIAPTGFEGA